MSFLRRNWNNEYVGTIYIIGKLSINEIKWRINREKAQKVKEILWPTWKFFLCAKKQVCGFRIVSHFHRPHFGEMFRQVAISENIEIFLQQFD